MSFVRALLGPDSATAALRGTFGEVSAQVFAREEAALPSEFAQWLMPMAGEPLGYRHVQLVSGSTVLSDAEIWFRVAPLSAAMQRQLLETDMPFGAVVAPLNPERLAIAVRAAPLRIDALLRVGGLTLAVARERYHEAALAAGWAARQGSAARAA